MTLNCYRHDMPPPDGHLSGVGRCRAAVSYDLCGRRSAAYRVRTLSYRRDGRTRRLPWRPAAHGADQLYPGRRCGQYGRWDAPTVDEARRSAGGPLSDAVPFLFERSSARRGARSMTSWRVDVGRPFVLHAASCVQRPPRLCAFFLCRCSSTLSIS